MMTQPSQLSVSFLDLLTCGMGGILLMFMLLLAVTQRFHITSVATEQRVQAPDDESPFVVLAAVDEKLQPNEAAAPGPIGLDITQWQGYSQSSGPGYAVLYARRPPLPSGPRIVVRKGKSAPPLVWVFHEGRGRKIAWPNSATGKLQVWPLPREAAEEVRSPP